MQPAPFAIASGIPEIPETPAEADAGPNGPGRDAFQIRAELADLLYASPWPVTANLCLTLLAVGLLSLVFATPIFLGWGVSIAGICAIRIVLWRLYHRHRAEPDFEP